MSAISEPTTFSVKTSRGAYKVRLGGGIVAGELASGRYRAAVTDARFATGLRGVAVVAVEASETNKTLSTVEEVILGLSGAGVRRGDQVIALGGGVVQDVATLAASLFLRGIQWSYAPTTLMAMADSCIGGKSSINAGNVKNLVGNIYPPTEVVVDPDFVRTLSTIDLISGLAEAAKICFCRSPNVFSHYLDVVPEQIASDADFVPVLEAALLAKRWFVEVDEFDRADRRLLNFGHTFGHALEAGTAFRVPHGVGVAVGMLAACCFVRGSAGTSIDALRSHVLELLGGLGELPQLVNPLDCDRFRDAFALDKKHTPDSYRLILPRAIGGVAVCEYPADPATIDHVENAMREALADIGV